MSEEYPFVFCRVPSERDLETLTVRSIGHFRYKPPVVCDRPRGWHVDVLVYTVAGCSNGEIGGVRSSARAGSLWIHPKDKPYRFDVDAKVGSWEGRWIEVDGRWFRPLLTRFNLDGVSHIPACGSVAESFEAVFDRFARLGEAADREIGSHVWRILSLAEQARARSATSDRKDRAVDRAREFVRRNIGKAIDLGDIAHAAGLSRFAFARLFKEKTGSSPIGFVRATRIARAQELLLDGVDIKRVARAVGYSSAAHFSAAFSRQTGCAPGKYRDSIRRCSGRP